MGMPRSGRRSSFARVSGVEAQGVEGLVGRRVAVQVLRFRVLVLEFRHGKLLLIAESAT